MTEEDLLALLLISTGNYDSLPPWDSPSLSVRLRGMCQQDFEESISRLMEDDLIETEEDHPHNLKISDYGKQFINEIISPESPIGG